MAESSVHREVILRATQPSARMKYASQTVLRDWWGLDVTWSQEAATPGWVVVIVAGEVVAAWPTHPIMRDEVLPDASTSVDWIHWKHEGQVPFELQCPCAHAVRSIPPEVEQELVLPVDLLAGTFWGLTCWDEQKGWPVEDSLGRPMTQGCHWHASEGRIMWAGQTIESKLQHRVPWIECIWLSMLHEWNLDCQPNFTWSATFDVDVAFKHLGRSRMKSWALGARDALMGQWTRWRERRRVMRGLIPDPYDTYAFVKSVHQDDRLTWFILAANRNPPIDVGLDPDGSVLPALAERLSHHVGGVDVGWHPGQATWNGEEERRREMERCHAWKGVNKCVVRSHFLLGQPGRAWTMWAQLGMTRECSLGWSRELGFRAAVSRPFFAFDVRTNAVLDLRIEPIAVMDSALRSLESSPDRANALLDQCMTWVAAVGGHWCWCWHNTSVSDSEDWVGWRSVYLHMVQSARSNGVSQTQQTWSK